MECRARLVRRTHVSCSAIDTSTQHLQYVWRRMCFLEYHGTPVWRMLFFTLSKKRKVKRFQGPTYIAIIPVPFLESDTKHRFPETRVSSITCAESCGCRQRFSPCGRTNMRVNSAERCSFASCRASTFIETICMGSEQQTHTYDRNKRNHRLPAQRCPQVDKCIQSTGVDGRDAMKHASALRQSQKKILMDLPPMSIAYEERVLPVTSFHEGSVPQKELERTVCVSGNTKATWRAQEQLLPHSAMWVVTTLSSALVLRADRQFFVQKHTRLISSVSADPAPHCIMKFFFRFS